MHANDYKHIYLFIYLTSPWKKKPYTIQVYATIAVGRPLVKISDKLQTKKKIEKKKSSLAATRVGID